MPAKDVACAGPSTAADKIVTTSSRSALNIRDRFRDAKQKGELRFKFVPEESVPTGAQQIQSIE